MNTNENHLHRILVVANETSSGDELQTIVAKRTGDDTRVLIVAPALNTRVRHLFSDCDAAIVAAELRLADCIEGLRRRGIEASGIVGDEDPLRAVEDMLHTFPADELVISTHTVERSNWLARDVVDRARERFNLPTSHVTVDVNRQAKEIVLLAA